MKNNQKGFIVPLIALIVVVVVVGIGYFQLNKKTNNPNSETPTTTQATTTNSVASHFTKNSTSTNTAAAQVKTPKSDLKTYSTSVGGFELQYPSDYCLNEDKSQISISVFISDKDCNPSTAYNNKFAFIIFAVPVSADSQTTVLENWKASMIATYNSANLKIINEQNVNVGGQNAVQFTTNSCDFSTQAITEKCYSIGVVYNNLFYRITMGPTSLQDLNTILHSLKFITVTDPLNLHLVQEKNTPTVQQNLSSFTACLKNSGTMLYSASWAPYLTTQQQKFGQYYTSIPYTECSSSDGQSELAVCQDKNITKYPTWYFPKVGLVSNILELQDIADDSGCRLP